MIAVHNACKSDLFLLYAIQNDLIKTINNFTKTFQEMNFTKSKDRQTIQNNQPKKKEANQSRRISNSNEEFQEFQLDA